MRKFIVLLLLLSAYCVEVNAQYMTARSIVVIKDKSRQKKVKEQANSDAEKEAFEEWKQQMQEKQAQLLNDKAAEEQARIAAEKEATAKAEAEHRAQEQARIAAEKEATAKAEAEHRAQEQARITAEKEATAKAKAEERARIAAEKKASSKVLKGYDQYANISYGYNSVCDFVGVNYIAGYRFNHQFFLGVGTGIDFALFTPTMEERFANCKPTRINIPVYANFRTNFLNKAWSPYISVSAGARISPAIQKTEGYTYNQSGALGDISFGVERNIGKKSSIYFGVGYRIESFLFVFRQYQPYYISYNSNNSIVHGFNVHVGVSF